MPSIQAYTLFTLFFFNIFVGYFICERSYKYKQL